MVRAAVQYVVLAFAAVFLAVSFLFWCALGATPGTIVLSKLGFSLGWSVLIAAVVCGIPLARYAMRRGSEAPAAAGTGPEPVSEATSAAPTVAAPPLSRRPNVTRFEELEAQEAELEARLQEIRRRKEELSERAGDPDPLDDAWFSRDRA